MGRFLCVLAAAAAVVLAGCGGGGEPAPDGDPAEVVGAAPDRTFAARRVRVEAATRSASSTGQLDLRRGLERLVVTGPPSPELELPLGIVDLLRGAAEIEPYGGQQVRGAATMRYELEIDPTRAVADTPEARRPAVEAFGPRPFYADVWVDGRGRVRRVQLPLERTTRRPHGREPKPEYLTIDLFEFEP